LRELNADLENRVRLRTQELAQQKKELEDVMNNIQQAILTLDSKGIINAEYSKYSIKLFGRDDISNLNIVDLVFSSEQREQDGNNLLMWLESIFSSPESFEMIQDFAMRDHEYSRLDNNGNSENR